MPLKILWFDTSSTHYEALRGVEAGSKLGVQVDAVESYDVQFAADGAQVGVFYKGKNLVQEYDAVIVRGFVPFVSETITLARLFADAGKLVIDEALTTQGYAMSKMHDYVMMAAHGAAVPRTQQFCDTQDLMNAADGFGYPCILKGSYGSRGRHVHKVNSREELRKKLMTYMPGEAMVQEYLDAPVDYRLVVIDYKALPVYVSRQPRPGDFRTNFEHNEIVTAHPLDEAPELRELAEKAARALGREFSGVDIRRRGNVPLVLEANRRPGFKDFERVTGYDVAGTFIGYVIEKCRR